MGLRAAASNTGPAGATGSTGAAGASGIVQWERKAADFNAAAGHKYLVDTTGGAVVGTLPASPADGDEIQFKNSATLAILSFTLNRNGKTINGVASNLAFTIVARTLISIHWDAVAATWISSP